jgi:tetratricopeptide (TPR) repeat protein
MLKQNQAVFCSRNQALSALVLFGLIFFAALPARAQTANNQGTERDRAIQLINDGKFAEALPIFEKLAVTNPADAQVQYGLGIATLMTSRELKDAQLTSARLRARTALLRAKELGVRDASLDLLLKSIAPDGGEPGVSKNKEARGAMEAAFRAFAARDYEQAAREYERAARLDPTLYEAALYTGNSHYALKNWDKAGEWFARAIALDADREIAYRYWGDALMGNGKQEAARDKFFDAIIAEPYDQLAWKGLIQWAQQNKIRLDHPKIEIPTSVSTGENGNVNITIDEKALGGSKTDGSAAWMMYGLARAGWGTDKNGKLSEKFSKAYPNEKKYRHSLAEESDALQLVMLSVREQGDIKQLEPSLAALSRLQKAGLIEPYILFARADQGIISDYALYRKANRDKLRRYLLEYVVTGGGK